MTRRRVARSRICHSMPKRSAIAVKPVCSEARSTARPAAANTTRKTKIMADKLNGYRILILETREEAQFSRLLTEQGAEVMQCPMFIIQDAPDTAPIEAWMGRFIERPFDDLVLTTGEGLRRLLKLA